MLYKVEALNPQGAMLSLQLDDVTDGFIVDDIQGLDPVKGVLVSSSFASIDGAQYQSSRREVRNILLTLALEPYLASDTVRVLRQRLYDFFMPKRPVTLRFYLEDGLIADLSCRVETCESQFFTQEPKVDISLIAFDPDFVELTPETISGNTTSTTTETAVTYTGTVETGFVLTLNVNRTITQFTIYLRSPDDVVKSFDFAGSLVSGDVVTISSVAGSKYVNLLRGSTTSSILYAMSPQSSWLEFDRGVNNLRVYATGAAIPYTIEYITRHGGL